MGVRFFHQTLELSSRGCLEFLDITEEIQNILTHSEISNGFLNVQSKHTTACVVVNENETRLMLDLKQTLQRLAPESIQYLHNDLHLRRPPIAPDEEKNGHSHCKALFLRTSEMLNVVDGKLQLGCWQRIFLLELDKPRTRTVSIMILGM
jgi:secondary thiamine-phosphate synthase enzyme